MKSDSRRKTVETVAISDWPPSWHPRPARDAWTLRWLHQGERCVGSAGFRADDTADDTGVRPRLLECLRASVHKGELARSASKSAPPTTTNVTGLRSFTDNGASSPSTTNVTTTHTAVGITPSGDNTPHTTDDALSRRQVEARLSDVVGLGEPERGVPRKRLSMRQPDGLRTHGWADLATGCGETVAEHVDRHGSEYLELPK